jgi:hypothetical protein
VGTRRLASAARQMRESGNGSVALRDSPRGAVTIVGAVVSAAPGVAVAAAADPAARARDTFAPGAHPQRQVCDGLPFHRQEGIA